jgi:hypothetical protein
MSRGVPKLALNPATAYGILLPIFFCTGASPVHGSITDGPLIKDQVMNVRNTFSLGSRSLFVLFLTVVLALATGVVNAQSFRGAIRGAVVDSQGLPVAEAKVVARNLGTSETREVTGDGEGNFRFLELPAGDYEVSAMAVGFEEVRVPQIRVDVGQETTVTITLTHVKATQERVEVTESVPLVETSNTTLSQVVDRQLVQEISGNWSRSPPA